MALHLIALAPREESDGYVFGHVRLSVRTPTSKGTTPIDLIRLHKNDYARGSDLPWDDPDRDPDMHLRRYLNILHHWR